jgi:hypothetical protein
VFAKCANSIPLVGQTPARDCTLRLPVGQRQVSWSFFD